MIKANELRIGNYVYVIKVVPIIVTADHIKSISEGDIDYTPIPLTPKILDSCGFKLDKRVGVWFETKPYNKDKTSVAIWDSHTMDYKWSMADNKHIQIKYLHQLQNLYFALTGKELTVNL